MFFDLDWQKLLKKKQKEYEEHLTRLHAILKLEESIKEEMKELAEVIGELKERQKLELKQRNEAQKEKDIRVLREYAESNMTGMAGKTNKLKAFFAERRIRKAEKTLALAQQREQAEQDVVVDSVTWEPAAPNRETKLKLEPEAFAPAPGMKSGH